MAFFRMAEDQESVVGKLLPQTGGRFCTGVSAVRQARVPNDILQTGPAPRQASPQLAKVLSIATGAGHMVKIVEDIVENKIVDCPSAGQELFRRLPHEENA